MASWLRIGSSGAGVVALALAGCAGEAPAPQAILAEIGVTAPAGAVIEHAEWMPGSEAGARVVVLAPAREWPRWRAHLVPTNARFTREDNVQLGSDHDGWAPGKAVGLATVSGPWRGGTEALNIGRAPAGGGRVRVFLYWHQL
jgi:hypothetical protein